MEEAESMVIMIEKWPRPGTLPWEMDAGIEFQRLENMIEGMRGKKVFQDLKTRRHVQACSF
jgi:hypothetical protein